MDLIVYDWRLLVEDLTRMAAAYILALPVAWERERSDRSAGLRTFPLVAVASGAFILIGAQLQGGNAESISRVIQGLMTGIGFVGGGTILKHTGSVHGTATAASIWATGAIGAAAALGRFDMGITLSVITFATLRLLKPLKRSVDSPKDTSSEERSPVNEGEDSATRSASSKQGGKDRGARKDEGSKYLRSPSD